MDDYIDVLKKQVSEYSGTLQEVVRLAPDYASLLCRLLNEPGLKRRHKQWVDAALAYLVSPDDVIPEEEVGPYGYVDDIFCCAYVASRIAEELGWDLLEEAWTGRNTVQEVSATLLNREQELLGHAGEDVLHRAGLLDRPEPDDESPGPEEDFLYAPA